MCRVLKPFEYFEPETVGEAMGILSTYGTKAKVLAGGIDLVARIRQREIQPECVVCIQKLPSLDYIGGDKATGLRFGALATLRSIELSPAIQKDYMVLYEAVHQIASVQVKTMGTAVGNLCVATPASDLATTLLALEAKLTIVSRVGERTIPLENFFIGVNQTVLEPSEIVTEVLLPSLPAGTVGTFMKLTRSAVDIAKVNVAVAVTVTDNICKEAKIALGSVAPTVIRAREAEGILNGQKLEPKIIAAAAEAAAEETKPITDIRSTAEYRKETIKVLVRRAIEKALVRARHREEIQ